MTRTIMREHIFKILFRTLFHDANELDEQIRFYFDEYPSAEEKDITYITDKAKKIAGMSDELDRKIDSISEGWPASRLGKAELTIMRLAVYEMLYDDDIPMSVAINEAVELAKQYGADSAPSLINGVLAKLTK